MANFNEGYLNSSNVVVYSYVIDVNMFMLIVFIVGTLTVSFKAGKGTINTRPSTQNLTYLNEEMIKKNEEALRCMMKKKLRMVVIFGIMMAVFLLSFLPFAMGRLLFDTGLFDSWTAVNQYLFLAGCHIFYKSSSLFNPLVTLTLKDDYRKSVVVIFRRIICSRSELKETQL